MCYGCYTSKSDELYSGECHIVEVDDEIYIATGGGTEDSYLCSITSNKRIRLPHGNLRPFGNKHSIVTYPLSIVELYWFTRAIYLKGYESAKEIFQIEKLSEES